MGTAEIALRVWHGDQSSRLSAAKAHNPSAATRHRPSPCSTLHAGYRSFFLAAAAAHDIMVEKIKVGMAWALACWQLRLLHTGCGRLLWLYSCMPTLAHVAWQVVVHIVKNALQCFCDLNFKFKQHGSMQMHWAGMV